MSRPLLLLLALLLLLTARGHVEAQQAPSLAVEPRTQTVALENGPFEVRVTVDDVTNDQGLGGYTLVMTYDPAVLHALTITDSGFVSSTENAVICPASAIDNDAGRLAHFCFTIPIIPEPGPQTSEPRVLATVRFEPIAEGITTLDISETSIIDPQGSGLAATTANGEVTVQRDAGGLAPTEAPTGTALAAGTEPAATAKADTGETSLPTSGTADGSSDRTVLYMALVFIGIGGMVLLATVLFVRMRRRAS